MIPGEGDTRPAGRDDVVEIDVSSLEALADQLHTLTGLPERHRDLSERKGEGIDFPRLQWAASVRTRDNDAALHAFEVVKALDDFCVRLRDASRKVSRDFTAADHYTAQELDKLADELAGSTPPDAR